MREFVNKKVMTDELKDLVRNIKEESNKKNITSFLIFFINKLQDFLDNKLSFEDLADISINLFVIDEDFSNKIEKFDSRLMELRKTMDLTHPSWSNDKRNDYVSKLKKLSYTILKDYSK